MRQVQHIIGKPLEQDTLIEQKLAILLHIIFVADEIMYLINFDLPVEAATPDS